MTEILRPATMRILDRIRRSLKADSESTAPAISSGYKILDQSQPPILNGWQNLAVAQRQHQAFASLLEEVRAGRPRSDFVVAARAVSATELADPLLIEVGCGSGYYSEALALLLEGPLRYVGVDRSDSMTLLAHHIYPAVPFVTADACRLPLSADCCDILLSGTSLMHIADYRTAISESVRVSRSWCIFHTVPVMTGRPTTFLTKEAYGGEVIEVIFNRDEIEETFAEYGLVIQAVFESIPYDVSTVVDEPTWTLTYLCRK